MMKRLLLLLTAALLAGGAWAGRATVEAQPRGKAVYDAHCVECHGAAGKGDGASAAFLVHRIPEPLRGNAITIPAAIEQDYAARDYGASQIP